MLVPLLIGLLCLAGIVPSGGFFSKEAVLAAVAAEHDPFHLALLGSALLTALLTALYSGRLALVLCLGAAATSRGDHPLPRLLVWPLWPLALAGLGAGIFAGQGAGHGLALAAVSTALALAGLALAWRFFRGPVASPEPLAAFLQQGWRIDTVYERLAVRPFVAMARFCAVGLDQAVIDGSLDLLAETCRAWGERLRRLATGYLSHYLAGFAWGLLVLLGWLLLTTVGG